MRGSTGPDQTGDTDLAASARAVDAPVDLPVGELDHAASLHRLLVALAEWRHAPTRASLSEVRAALERLGEIHGAAGLRLDLQAPPLPRLVLDVGSFANGWPRTREMVEAFTLHTVEGVRRLGVVYVEGPETIRLHTFDTVELAIDAAWSRAEAAAAAVRMESLIAAARDVAGVLSSQRVAKLVADRARDLVDARYSALALVDEDGVIIDWLASGMTHDERGRITMEPRGRGLLGYVMRENRSIRVADIEADPHRFGFPPGHPPMHGFLGLPISHKGRPIAYLFVTEKESGEPFTSADQGLIESLALHAGLALANARLHEQVEQLAIVRERERIGKDLHDGIIQSIYAVGLSLEDVGELMDEDQAEARARVERAIESLNHTIRDIRSFIFGLRPDLLEHGGLIAGLAALAEEFRLNTMLDIEVDAEHASAADVPPTAAGELLQLSREALSNVARHSKATHVEVKIATSEQAIDLEISDNGVGFDPDETRSIAHQGLLNMKARAAKLGGSMEIESAPGAGTRVVVHVPRRSSANGPHRQERR